MSTGLASVNPWLTGASAGIGILKSIFGHKNRFHDPHIDPFSFTPDENDPELALRRRRAILDTGRLHEGNVNELGRAGLLGSSAGFGILNQGDTAGLQIQEDITGDVFSKRRQEALHEYDLSNDFKRQVALSNLGGDISRENQSNLASMDSLGDIGGGVGALIQHLQSGGTLEDYLRKKKGLPTTDIMNASQWTPSLPNIRGAL